MPRTVLHLDLDAFYAAVEQRDKPSLRGKPVVVGGTGVRGVVATASYEARAFGVGSAMATGEARRRCPNAAYLAPRFAAYRTASGAVMALLHELSPVVEPLSLDEAYVDLTPAHPDLDAAAATALAERFRAQLRAATGLTASVGVGTSKLVAKIGSDLRKPDGLTVVEPGAEAALLAPLPVRRLPGVGAVTGARLAGLGVRTVGDLAAADEREVVGLLGRANGAALHAYARGADARPVVAERDAKSVSAEETFATDLTDRRLLADQVRRLAGRVTDRLRAAGVCGRTVTIKVRRYDFTTLGRSATLAQPTDDAREVTATALALLAGVDVADGVRLLGVGVAGLTEHVQQDLLADLLPRPEPSRPAPRGADGEGLPDAVGAAVLDAAVPDAGDPPGEDSSPDASPAGPAWRPGQDVVHAALGAGWVQGSGLGRVTVRFEGPRTPVGPVRTYRADDPDLAPADPPAW
ncbi:DNA polymerase IV [Quadrisphaera sp. DSM 44207]|uniref:DNA polymerase IV n=1 Tax=Quadrisphaera sp. DSM 44207 TaxID=1881057 RepID=UPI00087EE632|nr:DNA polymerase IV [Quadrisphaera sp. DSM 44207]SDQ89344.1 DNA polymerase-4 [Quadrisphaera sp. DSM 44207]